MNIRTSAIALTVSASLVVGCTSSQMIGAGSGAAAGALAGGLIGGDWKGALIGAAAGTALGWGTAALIEYSSRQVRTPEADQQIYGVTERVSSPVVKIRKGSSAPPQVLAGQEVNVATDYSLMLPQGLQDAEVQESWVLKKDGKVLTDLPPKQARRTGGGWQATAGITLPADAPPGTYVIEHKVQTGTSYDTDESVFVIAAS
jgi:hypothetical protein